MYVCIYIHMTCYSETAVVAIVYVDVRVCVRVYINICIYISGKERFAGIRQCGSKILKYLALGTKISSCRF